MTTTPQAALLSNAELLELWITASHQVPHSDRYLHYGRAILAKLQPAQEPAPRVTSDMVDRLQGICETLTSTRERLDQIEAELPAQEPVAQWLAWKENGGIEWLNGFHPKHEQYFYASPPDANGNTVEFTRAPVIVEPAQAAFQYVSCGHVKMGPETAAAYGKALSSMTEAAQAGELPDEREAFEDWAWKRLQLNTERCEPPEDGFYMWQSTMDAWMAWQAATERAAIAARKPLTMLEPTQIADACAGVYASDHAGKAYDQAVAMAAITEFCRINGIGLEVKP